MATSTITGSCNDTIYCSEGTYKGKRLWVTRGDSLCPIGGHRLEIVHHYGDKGEHYCPTGYLMCPHCGGVADEPEPYGCKKWGNK